MRSSGCSLRKTLSTGTVAVREAVTSPNTVVAVRSSGMQTPMATVVPLIPVALERRVVRLLLDEAGFRGCASMPATQEVLQGHAERIVALAGRHASVTIVGIHAALDAEVARLARIAPREASAVVAFIDAEATALVKASALALLDVAASRSESRCSVTQLH